MWSGWNSIKMLMNSRYCNSNQLLGLFYMLCLTFDPFKREQRMKDRRPICPIPVLLVCNYHLCSYVCVILPVILRPFVSIFFALFCLHCCFDWSPNFYSTGLKAQWYQSIAFEIHQQKMGQRQINHSEWFTMNQSIDKNQLTEMHIQDKNPKYGELEHQKKKRIPDIGSEYHHNTVLTSSQWHSDTILHMESAISSQNPQTSQTLQINTISFGKSWK